MDVAWQKCVLLIDVFSDGRHGGGVWRFVLHHVETGNVFSASDYEPHASRERLELLALVRGLEAIGGPAKVTVLSSSLGLRRGVERSLPHWRANHWRYERFGRLVPIRNEDLWRRIGHAMQYHKIRCRPLVCCADECTERVEAERGVSPMLRVTSRTDDGIDAPPPSFSEPAVLVVRTRRRHSVRIDAPVAAAS